MAMDVLDLSGVVGPRRQLTQAIARWLNEHHYSGLVYSSRLDAVLTCRATIEGASFEPAGPPEPILPNDWDLLAVATLFGLQV